MDRMLRLTIFMALLLAVATPSWAAYEIGPEDVLEVNFWQDPTLNTSVRVDLNGRITLDIIGDIEAAGKTAEQLQSEIVRQMSRLYKNVSQAVVRVSEYNYQHVFVTGQVNSPGKKTFEEIPDLLTILNEAGWSTETGDLSRVTIIRGGERSGDIEVIDLSRAIAERSVDQLPKINRQDAIDIPMTPMGTSPADYAGQADRRNIIYVLGAVREPGPRSFQDNIDVLEAVAMAGGYLDNADLRKTRVISKDGAYAQTLGFDLKEYAETGVPARYIMRKEDAIVIPYKRGGLFGSSLGTITTVLGAVTSAVLIYEAVKPSDN